MMSVEPLRWCSTCAVPHVENCPECFGFGVYADTRAPVTASAAHGEAAAGRAVAVCAGCGGGAANLPAARASAHIGAPTEDQ